MAAIAAALAGGSGPSILSGEVAPMRALLSQLSPKGGPEMVRVEDRDVGGVPVRVYTPQEAARGTIILFHGGGWTVGSVADRSEEHTSELQSLMRISYAVFCLKQKKKNENK